MRLKTFIARDMTDALAQVRREMGPDAVIVATTRTARGNLEVRAAVERPPAPAPEASEDAFHTPADIAAALAFHSAPPKLASELARAAAALGPEPAAALARALELRFAFLPLPVHPDRPLFLIGPPGSGKSSAAAKLAARAALAGHPVALVCADGARAGAIAQTRAYAEALQASMAFAPEPGALARAIAQREEDAATFIDGPPTNPFDLEEVEAVARLVRASGAEPVAVLDAGQQPLDLADAAAVFASLGARRMIVAKADAARRIGGALAAADAGLAFGAVSASPFVGGGVAPASPLRLARLLLDEAPAAAPAEAAV